MQQGTAAEHHGRQVGLEHEVAPELLHHDQVFGRAAAEAAERLGKSRAEDAELARKGAPAVGPPSGIGTHGRTARFEVIMVGQVARERVAQHRLFFAELEIHLGSFCKGCARNGKAGSRATRQ